MNKPRSLTENTADSDTAARNSCFCIAISYAGRDDARRSPRKVAGQCPTASLPVNCRSRMGPACTPRAAAVIEPPTLAPYDKRLPALRPDRESHETRHPPQLPHRQGRHDRWHRVLDAHHLGQGGRYAASRHRPEVAPGVDWRPAAPDRPRRPGVAVPEEVFGVFEERKSRQLGSALDLGLIRRPPAASPVAA